MSKTTNDWKEVPNTSLYYSTKPKLSTNHHYQ